MKSVTGKCTSQQFELLNELKRMTAFSKGDLLQIALDDLFEKHRDLLESGGNQWVRETQEAPLEKLIRW
jgi:hypothetical protein